MLGEDEVLGRGPFHQVASSEELRDEDRLGSCRVVVARYKFEDDAVVINQFWNQLRRLNISKCKIISISLI